MSWPQLLKFVLFQISIVLFQLGGSDGGQAQVALFNMLINPATSNYSVYDRPVANESDPVDVSINFYLLQLIDMNEKDGYLKASIWIEQKWKAYNLMWNPEEFQNIKDVRVDAKSVWRPDILLFNSADEKFDGTWPVNVVLNYDGSVSYTPPAMIKSACSIDIRWFPFDEQNCTLVYGSWTYTAQQLNLFAEWDKAEIQNYTNSSDWLLQSFRSFRTEYIYGTDTYAQVKLEIVVQRRSLYYYFNLILPCGIISLMALLVFSLPVDSGEKMGLSVTILLSLAVFMMTISDKLPRSSDSISQIGLYLIVMMILCSISVVLSVWVLNLYYYPNLEDPPPDWVRYGINIRLATLLCMKIPEDIREQTDFLKKQKRELKDMKANNSHSLLANVLDLNDELMHVAGEYCLRESRRSQQATAPPAYGPGMRMARAGGMEDEAVDFSGGRLSPLLYPQVPMPPLRTEFKSGVSGGAKGEPQVRQSYNKQTGESACEAGSEFEDGDKNNEGGEFGGQPRHCCQYRTQMKFILRELQCLSNKVHGDDKKEDIKSEWRFSARVIDRACLYVFAVLVVGFTIATLLSAPNHWKSLA